MAIFTEMSTSKCAKHPNPTRQSGICSSCLSERLLELAESYNHNSLHCSNSSSVFSSSNNDRYYYYYSYTTSSSSPINHSATITTASSSNFFAPKPKHSVHARHLSDVMKSISMVIGGGGSHELKKSRSVSVAVVREGGGDEGKKIRRGGGVWKKLLRVTAAGREKTSSASLVKSRTLKERFDE